MSNTYNQHNSNTSRDSCGGRRELVRFNFKAKQEDDDERLNYFSNDAFTSSENNKNTRASCPKVSLCTSNMPFDAICQRSSFAELQAEKDT